MDVLAGSLQLGQLFSWCGHQVRVLRVVPVDHDGRRPGVQVWISIDGTERRLHYYGDEFVTLSKERS